MTKPREIVPEASSAGGEARKTPMGIEPKPEKKKSSTEK